MDALLLMIVTFIGYIVMYRFYRSFIAKMIFKINNNNIAPSVEFEDGIDFVPTKKEILFGHHFTSIAGTGPIVGPAIAIIWGWVPAVLWVFIGSDWGEVAKKGRDNGIICREQSDFHTTYPAGYKAAYDRVDYVLIPSKWEGGPICALEAASQGIDVISADVGFVRDLLPSAKIFKNDAELSNILRNIVRLLAVNRSSLTGLSYHTCAQQIIDVARDL